MHCFSVPEYEPAHTRAFENFGPPGVLGERGRTRYRKLASSLQMVQAFAKIIETAELEERVRKLEEAIDK